MQDMSYYTETSVEPVDIGKCAESIGYQHQQYEFNGLHLNVLFQYEYNNATVQGYCRWTQDDSLTTDEAKRKRIIQELHFHPLREYWIQYSLSELPQVIKLLRAILEEYGGCVESTMSFKLFSLENINSLLDISARRNR